MLTALRYNEKSKLLKIYFILLSLLFVTISTYGQVRNNIDSLVNIQSVDTVSTNLDLKIDSIRNSFNFGLDSLKLIHQKKLTSLDSTQLRLQNKIDSLSSMNFPAESFRIKLDSIQDQKLNEAKNFRAKLESVKDKAKSKLNKLEGPSDQMSKVNSMTSLIDRVKVPSDNLNLSPLNIDNIPSQISLEKIKLSELGNHFENGSALNQINGVKLQLPQGDINAERQVKNISEGLPNASGISDQVKGYDNDVKGLAKGDLSKTDELAKTAETKVQEVSGINEFQNQTKPLEEYKNLPGKIRNPDSLKAIAFKQYKLPINHFAGKEEQLKKAMDEISKYKNKYKSINNFKELPKNHNEMKGKPFIERLVPGIVMQIQNKGGDLLIDFNPTFGYRLTGKVTTGLGWNQRIPYNIKRTSFNPSARIFGPRVFGEIRIWKGFSPRAEIELMNTLVPPFNSSPVDFDNREWVCGIFLGIKKQYRFIKNVRGTALVMMRLNNPDHKSPYSDVVNVRFGFDFPMKKKTDKTAAK